MLDDPEFGDFDAFAVLFELFLDQPEENERESVESEPQTVNEITTTTTDQNIEQYTRFREYNTLALSDRVAFLMKFPQFFQKAMNSSDFQMLYNLCVNCCTADLIVQPSTIKEITGIRESVEYFFAINKVLPDLVINFQPAKRYKRVIACKSFSDMSFFDGQEELPDKYNIFTQGPVDPLVTPEMRAMYQSYKAAGKPIHIRSHTSMFMILNDEMTHIMKIVLYRRGLTLSDVSFS